MKCLLLFSKASRRLEDFGGCFFQLATFFLIFSLLFFRPVESSALKECCVWMLRSATLRADFSRREVSLSLL